MRVLWLIPLLVLGACDLLAADADVVVLYVDAQTAPCRGEAAQVCLRVRTSPEAAWALFYDPIEGFTHEAGVAYVLRVEVTDVADPPADGSSRRYRLLAIVSRTRG